MTKEIIWVSLAQAIKGGLPIDWAALSTSGTRAMLTCHKGSACCKVRGGLRTSGAKTSPLEDIDGWVFSGPTEFSLSDIMHDGWNDSSWVLWVRGKIPMRQLTAAHLPLGTCFLDMEGHPCFVFENEEGQRRARSLYASVSKPAEEVEVQSTYGVGTFRPDGQEDA